MTEFKTSIAFGSANVVLLVIRLQMRMGRQHRDQQKNQDYEISEDSSTLRVSRGQLSLSSLQDLEGCKSQTKYLLLTKTLEWMLEQHTSICMLLEAGK